MALGLSVFLLGSATLVAATLELRSEKTQVPQFEKIEFDLTLPAEPANPVQPHDINLTVELRGPNGLVAGVPAFFMQPYERRAMEQGGRVRDWVYPRGLPRWKARYAADRVGSFEARAIWRHSGGALTSAPVTFNAVSSPRRGYLRVSAADPRFLEFTSGQPFFGIGQNLAFIGNAQRVNLAKVEGIFDKFAAHGANYLRVWTCCEDWALAIEARKSAWGRSWGGRGPVVELPDAGGRKGLLLTASNATLQVNPSHDLALLPSTRYVVTGRVRAREGSPRVRLELQGTRFVLPTSVDAGWVPLRHEFTTGPADRWLAGMQFRLEEAGSVWLSDLSLRESAGGPELLWEAEVNRPVRGYYNPVDCFLLDELIDSAERHGIYLQLCLLTRDVYMDALKDPQSQTYTQAITDAQRTLRYAVARWGYSTHVAAWEFWNEMNPGLPTDRFYSELGEYLDRIDPYQHLRTTSTWGPSAKDCRHPKLELADTHFYLRPSDKSRLRDEVEAVLERTAWLRQHAPAKPAHLGEFGLANEKWQPTPEMNSSRELVDFHHGLWASALSGASTTALFWWWERLDTRNHYPLYQPLSAFLADVPWTAGKLQAFNDTIPDQTVRVVGLRSTNHVWTWFFNRAAAWQQTVIDKRTPPEVNGAQFELREFPDGAYQVRWWDTRAGKVIRSDTVTARQGRLLLQLPPFARDVACRIYP